MACTNQSAVKYILNAKKLLVENLKNPKLIAEKLQEKVKGKEFGVFNVHEFSAVTSEKNPLEQNIQILDIVIKKGEEACYEFLRILDNERNRILPKVKPDLHHWISSFSFREEPDVESTGSKPCQQYQSQLKSKAQTILKAQMKDIKYLLKLSAKETFSYTKLVLDRDEESWPMSTKFKVKSKKYKTCRTKKLRTYIPQNEIKLSPEDLLKYNGQNVLLIGKPGIGKTTVTLEMINLWKNMENTRLNYLFYFDMKTLTDMSVSLESLLFDFYVEPRNDKEEVLMDIRENSEHVIIIFDGIREVPLNSILYKIITKELLPEAKVVLTCRPECEEILPEWEACRVCVQGFNEEALQTYFSHMLRDRSDAVSLIMGNPELCSLCHVPVHALMVAVCILFQDAEAHNLCTATEIYLRIFRYIMMRCGENSRLEEIDETIQCNRENILHLCQLALDAIKQRSIIIQHSNYGNIERNFLNKFTLRVGPTEEKSYCSFLHNTMQEFFAALGLLANPGDIDGVLQDCKSEEGKHMRHVIPFLCGLLSEKNVSLVNCLFPEVHIQQVLSEFHDKLFRTFLHIQPDSIVKDEDCSEDLVFLCQCLFESQSPHQCFMFLWKMKYNLKLTDGCFDPYQYCAVSYIIKQSKDKKTVLDLKNCDVSEQVLKLILDCCQHIRLTPPHLESIPCEEWEQREKSIHLDLCLQAAALYKGESVLNTIRKLLTLFGVHNESDFFLDLYVHAKDCKNEVKQSLISVLLPVFLSAPAVWSIDLSKRKASVLLQVMKLQTQKKQVELRGWSEEETEVRCFLQCLPYISHLRFPPPEDGSITFEEWVQRMKSFLLHLCLQAAICERESVLTTVRTLLKLLSHYNESDFLLDLYSHTKDCESKTDRSVISALLPVYQSDPAVWSIDLSKQKASIFLEVLKLQAQKKPVELKGWSEEEAELRSFLQCLPYISQLRFAAPADGSISPGEWEQRVRSFHLDLCLQEALCKRQNVLITVRILLTVSSVYDESEFLLDLYSHAREYESQTGRSLISTLQPVYQSTPAVWSIDLSERKASLFLEVLKLQAQKKLVELKGWSEEEAELRSFLQCLPYISQLRLIPPRLQRISTKEWEQREKSFPLHLCVQAALCKKESLLTTVKTLLKLLSVHNESDFLIDLYAHAKDHESQTGKNLISALLPVYQSPPAVWSVDFSKRTASFFLEVLKLQRQKKPVELKNWANENMGNFIYCLPYISHLRFRENHIRDAAETVCQLLVNLSVAAAEFDAASGKRFSELLSSVCSYSTFPLDKEDTLKRSDFLIDLYSHMTACETKRGRRLLPAYRSVFKSADAVWSIDLSERKVSSLLEVLKLQTQKKSVVLSGCPNEENEVRSFLQCLPYISQLRFTLDLIQKKSSSAIQFLVNLTVAAVDHDSSSGRSFSEHLSSLCSHHSFPIQECYIQTLQTDFLLDLYSHVLDCKIGTAENFLQSFQKVYQSLHAVFFIDLSKRKTSLLLEVLKLQTQKKPVELIGFPDEESEVRSFVQCLPYIAQLRFNLELIIEKASSTIQFLVNLSVAAADHDSASGGRFSEHLSSVCSYSSFPFRDIEEDSDYTIDSNFLLDLCSQILATEAETSKKLISSFQSVYQSAPPFWSINLSERKTFLLLEVLKLQTQKKPVELRGLPDEESEVRSFVQCLSYISQLRFDWGLIYHKTSSTIQFLVKLSVAAADHDSASGRSISEHLSSVCSYSSFPFQDVGEDSDYTIESNFLLDLCSQILATEAETSKKLISSFQSVYQSAPPFWSINLSETKASLLLEVLKLQTQKKPVELIGLPDEESEVRSFVRCLSYISQLRFNLELIIEKASSTIQFLVNLSIAAADHDSASGGRFSEHLSSVCSYSSFPFQDIEEENDYTIDSNFLLDLCSQILATEAETSKKLISSFQSVYQSAPPFWSINLSERKTSILLEVLKLQTQKKPVKLRGLPDEESEVRSFVQCLSYISQLRFDWGLIYHKTSSTIQFLVKLSVAAADHDSASGRSISEHLSSVCSYSSFPFQDVGEDSDYTIESNFLLDLCSQILATEAETSKKLISSFQSVYQSAPPFWSINLSDRKTSILLEVLKLQTQKKPVELIGLPDEESEVRSFVQCLSYISQLRFDCGLICHETSSTIQFLVNLSVAAADHVSASGRSFSEHMSSVCSYSSFPTEENYANALQTDFLLNLYSHLLAYEAGTAMKILPTFQSVYQSAPSVWSINLSKQKASLFFEVLKLHTQKKPVELRGLPDEESEVRSFLQCLPCISELRFHVCCDSQSLLFKCVSVGSQRELTQLFQTLDFNLKLQGVLHSSKCRSLGRAISWVASNMDLTLIPKHISLRGIRLLFRGVTQLHKLSLNGVMVMRLARAMTTGRGLTPTTVEELSLDLRINTQQIKVSQRVLSRVLSCLALLLRHWTVWCLNLTSCRVEGQTLITFLCQQNPPKLRLSKENMQQLSLLVSEVQDDDLTQSFLDKVGGDLTTCTLTQEVVLYLLQCYSKPVTVDFRKSQITEWSARKFLPLLDRIHIKRSTPGFIINVIREIFPTRSPQYVRSLLRSTKNYISLTTRGLDAADCAALCFILQHSQAVRLNLMWTSIPEGELESLLQLIGNVSQLSVDRQLLWRFLHCCKSLDVQQGAAVPLLQALQHRLDFSCSTAMELTEEYTKEPPLPFSSEDCRIISMVIKRVNTKTELNVMDCTVDEAGLEHIYSVLERVHLRCSKAQLLQLLTLVRVGSERECVRRAVSLSHAVGGEVDLSHTVLDPRACGSLALFLEYSEGLSELDLSYCQLTDSCLEPLLPHLHKIQVLDLSNNSITDQGAELIYNKVNETNSIEAVRLFNNRIMSTQLYQGDKRFELWR